MLTRILLCGACLVGIHAGTATAQTLASATDRPVTRQPMIVDESSKAPGDVPEIIKGEDETANFDEWLMVHDPEAALRPPAANPDFLRAIRLDWDQLRAGRFAEK